MKLRTLQKKKKKKKKKLKVWTNAIKLITL
jgi:hypothetical protein